MTSSRRSASDRRICIRCEYMFDTPDELQAHILSHHKNGRKNRESLQKENSEPKKRSKTPEISSSGLENGKKILKRGRRPQVNYKIGIGLPEGGSYIEEDQQLIEPGNEVTPSKKEPWKPFACNACPFRTGYVRSLRAHIASKHRDWRFVCSVCDTRFALATALRQHERVVHPEALERRLAEAVEDETADAAASGGYRCVECGSMFESPKALKLHMTRKHRCALPPKEPVCEICQRRFSNIYGLARHRKVVHEKSAPKMTFVCKVCGRQCATKYTLQNHELLHSEQKNFPCPVEGCSRRFTSQCALKLHHRRSHLNRSFPCSQCSRVFRYRSCLTSHQRAHHSLAPAFTCPICAKTLLYRSSRQRHLRRHSQAKRHRCDLCAFATHEAKSLKRHKTTRHTTVEAGEPPKEPAKTPEKPKESSETPKEPAKTPEKPKESSETPKEPPPPRAATPLASVDFLTSLKAPLAELASEASSFCEDQPPEETPTVAAEDGSEQILVYNSETKTYELIPTNRFRFDGQKVVLLPDSAISV